MTEDCGFSKGNYWFRYRSGAFVLHEGKLLFVRSKFGGYYYMIGGAVHLGETSADCIVREVREEAGIDTRIDHLAVVTENFFKGRDGVFDGMDCHVLEFYYILGIEDANGLRTVNDEGEELCWLSIEEAKSADIKPSFIPERLEEILSSASVLHIIEERDR